jgi:hypothetical protein
MKKNLSILILITLMLLLMPTVVYAGGQVYKAEFVKDYYDGSDTYYKIKSYSYGYRSVKSVLYSYHVKGVYEVYAPNVVGATFPYRITDSLLFIAGKSSAISLVLTLHIQESYPYFAELDYVRYDYDSDTAYWYAIATVSDNPNIGNSSLNVYGTTVNYRVLHFPYIFNVTNNNGSLSITINIASVSTTVNYYINSWVDESDFIVGVGTGWLLPHWTTDKIYYNQSIVYASGYETSYPIYLENQLEYISFNEHALTLTTVSYGIKNNELTQRFITLGATVIVMMAPFIVPRINMPSVFSRRILKAMDILVFLIGVMALITLNFLYNIGWLYIILYILLWWLGVYNK